MAKLTTAKRKALPKSEFALPGGKYPIPDKSHARNAKARASEMEHKGKLSAGQKATIDAKADRVLGKENDMKKMTTKAPAKAKAKKTPMKKGIAKAPASGGGFIPMTEEKIGPQPAAKKTTTVGKKGGKKTSALAKAPTKRYGANGVGGEWGSASREGV